MLLSATDHQDNAIAPSMPEPQDMTHDSVDSTLSSTSDAVFASDVDTATGEVHPEHPPVVPLPQDPFIPRTRLQRLVGLFTSAQFARYLAVGVFNTVFGYSMFVVALALLNRAAPAKYLYLMAPLASILSTPLNITVAYFGYKLFVFRTRGNHLVEWLKCFAVYGTGMLPGLFALSALTRLLQSVLHTHAASLHSTVAQTESHLNGAPLHALQHMHGSAAAGYLAGAIVTAASTVYSFVGHKKVTFRQKAA